MRSVVLPTVGPIWGRTSYGIASIVVGLGFCAEIRRIRPATHTPAPSPGAIVHLPGGLVPCYAAGMLSVKTAFVANAHGEILTPPVLPAASGTNRQSP
jgi:hypothetical protein